MALRFLGGFGLGVLVLPLTLLFTGMAGWHGGAGFVAFGALTAGAISLRPVTGGHVTGVLTGIGTCAAAMFAVFVAMLSTAQFG